MLKVLTSNQLYPQVLMNQIGLQCCLQSKKRDKPKVAARLVSEIRQQIPPGRFLQKNDDTGLWDDIGDVKAQEKTSQALREGAPEIRHDIKQQLEKDGLSVNGVMSGAVTKKRKKKDENGVVFDEMHPLRVKQALQALPRSFNSPIPSVVPAPCTSGAPERGLLYDLATFSDLRQSQSLPFNGPANSVGFNSYKTGAESFKKNPSFSQPFIPAGTDNMIGKTTCPQTLISQPCVSFPKVPITTTSLKQPYTLKGVITPNVNDVLCGRGGGTNIHVGNERFRLLVKESKRLYLKSKKRDKPEIARDIVSKIRNANPSGRFLQKNEQTNMWDDIGNLQAQKKTSQALREGAPDIRNDLKQERDGRISHSGLPHWEGNSGHLKADGKLSPSARNQSFAFHNLKHAELEKHKLPPLVAVNDLSSPPAGRRFTGNNTFGSMNRPMNQYNSLNVPIHLNGRGNTTSLEGTQAPIPEIYLSGTMGGTALQRQLMPVSEMSSGNVVPHQHVTSMSRRPTLEVINQKASDQGWCSGYDCKTPHKIPRELQHQKLRDNIHPVLVSDESEPDFLKKTFSYQQTQFDTTREKKNKKIKMRGPWIFSDLDYEVYELLKNKEKEQRIKHKEAAEYQDAALMGYSADEIEKKCLLPQSFKSPILDKRRKCTHPASKTQVLVGTTDAQKEQVPKMPMNADSNSVPVQPVSKDEKEVLSSLVSLRQGLSPSVLDQRTNSSC